MVDLKVLEMEKYITITITHFINPQHFWYVKDKESEQKQEICKVENSINNHFKDTPISQSIINANDLVAVKYLPLGKYIRARVQCTLQKNGIDEYILWALDYGFPFQSNLNYIHKIPKEFGKFFRVVRSGGLYGMLPADEIYNFEEMCTKYVKKDTWCQNSCKELEALLTKKKIVAFSEQYAAPNGKVWGDLRLYNDDGSFFSATNYLASKKYAIEADGIFQEICKTLKCAQIMPWLSNDGITFNVKQNISYKEKTEENYASERRDRAKKNTAERKDREKENTLELKDREKNNTAEWEDLIKEGTPDLLNAFLNHKKLSLKSKMLGSKPDSANFKIDVNHSSTVEKNTANNCSSLKTNLGVDLHDISDAKAESLNHSEDKCNDKKSLLVTEMKNISLNEEAVSGKSNASNPHTDRRAMLLALKRKLESTSSTKVDSSVVSKEKDIALLNKKAEETKPNKPQPRNNMVHVNKETFGMIPAGFDFTHPSRRATQNSRTAILLNSNSSFPSVKPYLETNKEYRSLANASLATRYENNCNSSNAKVQESISDTQTTLRQKRNRHHELLQPEKQIDKIKEIISNAVDKVIPHEETVFSTLPAVERAGGTESHPSESHEHLLQCSNDYELKSCYVENLMLAHSTTKPHAIQKLADACFPAKIYENLKAIHLNKLFRLQAYSWSFLQRGNSLFIVNAMRSGKTWSYIPPICSKVYHSLLNPIEKDSYGPLGIILVASSAQVQYVHGYCQQLLPNVNEHMIESVVSYSLRDSSQSKFKLFNTCGLLIATPVSLMQLLEDNKKERLIDFRRLKMFIIDDFDTIYLRAENKIENILTNITSNSKDKCLALQLVLITCEWNQRLVPFICASNNPLLLIGDFLEAAVYGRSVISINLSKHDEKIAKILSFAKMHPPQRERRLVIFCTNDDDVQRLYSSLTCKGLECISFDGGTQANMEIFKSERKEKKTLHQAGVIICTDAIFLELNIYKAQNIIHYSMPNTWTKFKRRFVVIIERYENRVSSNFSPKSLNETLVPHSLVLLDEHHNEQLPRLVEFMQKHNQGKAIHPDILNVAKLITQKRSEDCNIAICRQLLEFGKCVESHCFKRHILAPSDFTSVNGDLPMSGDIQVKILKVYSPTHYIARLLRSRLPNCKTWQEFDFAKHAIQFNLDLNLHYAKTDNLIPYWPPKVNDLCVYKPASGNVERAIIFDVPSTKSIKKMQLYGLKLKLIDAGAILTKVELNSIFVCHDRFKACVRHLLDIRLLGVMPIDNEPTWDSKSTKEVQRWLIDDIEIQQDVQLQVEFTLDDTVWAQNIMILEQLPTTRHCVRRLNLKRKLFEKKFALASHSMLQDLYNSANTFKDKLDNNFNNNEDDAKYLDKCTRSPKKVEIAVPPLSASHLKNPDQSIDTNGSFEKEQWCSIPLNRIINVEIDGDQNGNWLNMLLQIIDEESIEKYDELNSLILQHVNNIKLMSDKHFENYTLKPMQNCIIKYNGEYCRAKMCNVNDDEYRFFLCDWACFITRKFNQLYDDFLYPITNEIIEFTPFQVIHCTLAGVQLHPSCKQNYKVTKRYLYAYAVTANESYFNVCDGIKLSSYNILLYECEEKNKIFTAQLVNNALVEQKLASLHSKTQHFLELDATIRKVELEKERSSDSNMQFATFEEILKSTEVCLSFHKENLEEKKRKANSNESSELHSDVHSDVHSEMYSKVYSEVQSAVQSEVHLDSKLPALKAMHKRPRTVWYDTNFCIYISINAPDIKNYYLQVTAKTLIFKAIINDEKYALILNLYGRVKPKYVIHKICGLNVCVTLVKTIALKYPRLLQQTTKFPWLISDLSKITIDEFQHLPRFQKLNRGLEQNYSDSDTDTEFEKVGIDNCDKLRDPLSDI